MEWGVGGPVLEHGPSDSGERGGWRGGRRGHRSRQEQKLRAQRVSEQEAQDQQEELLGNNGERSKIFDGVAAYFEGYTDKYGDYELKRMLVAHGGYVCQAMKVTRTTHLVCSNLAAAKVNAMIGRFGTRFSVLVVRPSWIARSVATGRRLAEGPFAVLPAELIAGGPSIAKVFKPLEDADGGNRKADGEKRSFGKKQRQAFTPVPSPTDSDENVARGSKGATPTIGKRRSSRATRSKKDLRAAIAQLSKRAYHRKVGLCATVGVGQELCIRRDGSRGAK